MRLDAGCDRSPTWRTHSSHLDDGGGLLTILIAACISGLGESGPSGGLLTTTLLLAYYSLFRVTVTDYTQHEDCRITAPRWYAESVTGREFRQYIAELLAKQRNPDPPVKKNLSSPETIPKPTSMTDREFRKHIHQLLARQRNADRQLAVPETPPASQKSKPPAVTEKKPPAKEERPAVETRKFTGRRKAK